MAYDAKKLMGK